MVLREKSGILFSHPSATSDGRIASSPMSPRSVLEERINIITPFYRLGKRDPYLVPGDYDVVFIYESQGYEPVRSNTVSVCVRDPRGREGRALELLNEGDTQYRLGEIRKSDGCYERLVRKYPESLYAPSALELIFRNHDDRMGPEHRAIRLHAAVRLIDGYRHSEFNTVRMIYELEEALDRGMISDSMRSVILRWKDHPQPEVRRFVRGTMRRQKTLNAR
jgi:hypothetical protein